MDKGIVFRETFRGYNKDDVNEYIKNINDNFVSSEEEYKKEISKKDEQINVLNEKLKDFESVNSKYSELVEKLEKYDSEAKEYSSKVEEAQKAAENKEEIISALNSEIELLKNEVAQSKEEMKKIESKLSASEFESKSMMYDQMSSQIGDIILKANKDAKNIIENAQLEAKQIRENACNEFNKAKSDMKEKALVEIARFKREINLSFENYIKTANDDVKEIKSFMDEVLDKVNEKNAKLSEKSSAFEENAVKTVDLILEDFENGLKQDITSL